MNQVEVLDNGVVLNGNLLTFPLSYEDIRALFGEARINVQSDNHCEYFYDELGISFEGATAYLRNLKKQKAYIDLSLIHISEPTRRTPISYAVFCLKKKKTRHSTQS